MNSIFLETHFRGKIEEIWEKYSYIEETKRGYHLQSEQEENSILFIGINPSKSKEDVIKGFYNKGKDEDNKNPYFQRFVDIAKKTGLPWSHIDLFYIRETSQKKMENLLKSKNLTIFSDFLKEQLELSKEMIEMVNPKILVVSNTLARDLIRGKYCNIYDFQYKIHFEERFGTEVITGENTNLKGVPVFFTSMLTGQRALDNGSYDRLVWHIKYVNKILEDKIENTILFKS